MFGWRLSKSRLAIAKVAAIIFLIATFVFSFYFWRLGTLPRGLGPAEVNARSSSSSLQVIIDNPVYAPHKILAYGVQKIFGQSALTLRSLSAVLAVLFLICFYRLVKGWFGKMIGLFATLFLAATPWFVLLARSGTPEIILLTPMVVLTSYYWLTKSKSMLAWLALLASGGLVIYLPGGLLLIGLSLIFARRNLKSATVDLGLPSKILGSLTLLVVLSPLVYAVSKNPSALKPLLLIPADWPSAWVGVKSVVWEVLALFWRTPVHADFLLGRLPMYSGAQVVLALFGGFALLRLARSKLYILFAMLVFGVLAAGINRNLALLTYVLPAVSLAAAGGLRYLYMEWRSVFPKNPLPKYLALTLIAALVVMHVFYGLRYSLIAWPNSAATRTTYVLK